MIMSVMTDCQTKTDPPKILFNNIAQREILVACGQQEAAAATFTIQQNLWPFLAVASKWFWLQTS